MKAKDYAAQYLVTKNEATLAVSFVHELADEIARRDCQTNRACLGLVKEFQQKWQACQRLTGITREFQFVMESIMPEFCVELWQGPGVYEELGWKI